MRARHAPEFQTPLFGHAMSLPPEIAKKRRWPIVGIVVGPILLLVPFGIFVSALLSLQGDMGSGGAADPRQTIEHFRLMSISGASLIVFIPLGAGAIIFSVMRLARLRRQTPPKLPPA